VLLIIHGQHRKAVERSWTHLNVALTVADFNAREITVAPVGAWGARVSLILRGREGAERNVLPADIGRLADCAGGTVSNVLYHCRMSALKETDGENKQVGVCLTL
jgi:hypothetical protein